MIKNKPIKTITLIKLFSILSYLMLSSQAIKGQTLLSGGFEQCVGASLFNTGNNVQTLLAGCNTNYGFSGTGNAFYAGSGLASAQGTITHTSPTAPEGNLSVGLGIDAVVSLKLSAPMVVGNYYRITLKVMNSIGTPASSNNIRLDFGSSTSATSFGTFFGNSVPVVPSSTFSLIDYTFKATTTDDFIAITLSTVAGDLAVANANNIAFLDDVTFQVVTPKPFNCGDNWGYLSQGSASSATTLYAVAAPTNTISLTPMGTNSHGASYNSMGYNSVDDYIYGITRSYAKGGSPNLIRIDANGVVTNVGEVTGIPVLFPLGGFIAADFDASGNFYLKRNGVTNEIFKINVTTLAVTTITLASAFVTSDFCCNPIDGELYCQFGNDLIKANLVTGVVTTVGPHGVSLGGAGAFGAMYADALGNVYGSANGGGVYQFNTTNGVATFLGNSPGTSNNDGAMCANSTFTITADLGITKTDGTFTVTPGSTTTYTIVASNTGPFAVQTVTVTDALPVGIPAGNFSYTAITSTAIVSGTALTATSTTGVAGTQTGAINDVITLPVGTSVTYIVTVAIPLTYTLNLINTATIAAPNNAVDPNPSNNVATDIDGIPPVAVTNTLSTPQGTTATGTLAGNDIGADAVNSPTFTVTQPASTTGTITINPTTGSYTFTPNPSYVGSGSTTYTLCNNTGSCSSTTITYTVTGTTPLAVADATTTTQGTPVSGGLGTNDTGAGAINSPTFTVTQPSATNGSITIDPTTGSYTFTPNPSYVGSGSTTYTLCNNTGSCSSTTITYNVIVPFICNESIYLSTSLSTSDPTTLQSINYHVLPYTMTAIGNNSHGFVYNAIGYNKVDNYIYAVSRTGNTLFRIGNNGMVQNLGVVAGLPSDSYVSGDVLSDGNTYVVRANSANRALYSINIANRTATVLANLVDNIADLVYNPVTNRLYATTNATGILLSINPSTGTVTAVGNTNVSSAFGALFASNNGRIFGIENLGSLYEFNLTTGNATLVNTVSGSINQLDGTACISDFGFPIAVADATTTTENTPVGGDASANDSGALPTLNPVFTSGPVTAGTGTLTMNPATGQYTYTPAPGFTGTTTATYTLCNLSSPPCSTTTITFTVFPTLVANPDVIATTPSVTTTGTLTTNDGGVVPGGTYTVTVTQPSPTTGTITVNPATGQYTFTPNPSYTGSTTTTYTICNTAVTPIVCSNSTITITVGILPVAVADATTTTENTPVGGDASANDNGALPTLNPVFTSGPVTAGTGTLTMDPATGQYTYTPAPGFTGTTTATYTLCNLSSPPCSTTTITFTVFPILIANPDVITTTPSVSVTGTLSTNDGGVVPGGTYSVTVTQPSPTTGTITVDPATGQYTFTPNPSYTGSTTTTYTICNTSVTPIVCSNSTITITVGNLPVAVADATTTIENTPVSGGVSGNDSGAIPTLNPVFTSGPVTAGTGTLTMDPATGQYTYTPAPGFTGTTTATYTLCNLSSPPCSTTTITFTVFPILVANPDVITTTPSVSVTGTLSTNDGGVVPGGTYSVTVTQPSPTTGTITVDPATGGYTFTPNPAFTGTTTTTYTICNIVVNPIVCSTTTITIIIGTPKIAVAKTVLSTKKTNATTYQSVFSFNVANLGNTVGTNVQLVDNLNNTFPAPITYTLVGVTANNPLTSNAAYNGNTTVAMLSGTNSLNPLQSSVVTLTVNFSPNNTTLTVLSNSGIGSTASNPDPTGTGSHTSIDTTDAGINPDSDGDGNPNEPGENDPTTFGQQIAASKKASTLTKVNATTFQTVFTFNVANVGPVTSTNVQLTDNLNSTFPAPMTYTVVGLNANAPLTANGAYNGNTNIALLSGSNSLVSGVNALVTLTVNFSINSSTATTLTNIGIASTSYSPDPTGGGSHTSIDTTDSGTNPDPNGDGIPGEPGENDPTTFGQQIGAAKTSSGSTKINATTFQTVFTFNVANYGPVAATNVQLTDNLNSTFPAPMTYTVLGLNANAPLISNAGYNGNSNIAMLSGTNTLNALQSSIVTLTVNFSPNTTTLTSLSNIGIASSSDAPDPTGGGTHTSIDTTGTGTNPDPDGDGNPNEPGENNPTFFGQQVAGAKTASTLIKVNATTYQTVFTFNVTNVGPVAATNIQLTDNLNNTFLAPMTYTVVGLNANTPLTVNAGYNGNTNIALLSGNNTLNVSQNSIVTLTVNFSSNSSAVTSLNNIGIVSSSSAPDPTGNGTHTSTDTTDAGTNPDPDGDGHPNEPGENDPTHFGQQIGAAKSVVSTTKIDNGDNQTTFVFTIQNLGVVPATNVQLIDNLNTTFPSPITYNVSSLVAGSSLTTNSAYTGGSNINLLVGTNTLAVGAMETVTLVVNYKMNGSSLTTLYNIGFASTSDAGGVVSTDTTNTGTNPDANGNGNPNEPSENTPTPFEPIPDVTNPDFSIPQGFSPNGDGVNDLFVIKGLAAYPENKLSILNRWGNIVYKMESYDNTWNGKSSEGYRFGGDELPEGTYFYILDLGNGEKPHKGYIYLNKAIK